MADSSYELSVKTTRQGAGVAESSAELKQLNEATDQAAASATKLTTANTALAASEQSVAQSWKQRKAAIIAGTTGEVPHIIDNTGSGGPGGFINTAGDLEQVSKSAAAATQSVNLTVGAVNTATDAFALTAANIRTAAAATQINTTAQLEQVAATEEVTAAELQKWAATVAATEATAANSAVTVENSLLQQLATINTTGLGAAIGRLSTQMLGIQGIGRGFLNPMVVGILVAVAAYQKATESLKEWNDEMDKQSEKAADPTFKSAIDARTESLLKSRLEMEAYRDRLSHLVDPEQKIFDSFQKMIALEKERASVQKSVSDAQFGLESSRLKNLHDEGIVSTTNYYLRLEELEKKHIADALKIEQEGDAKEIALKQAQLDRAIGKTPDVSAAVDARSKSASASEAKRDSTAAFLSQQEKDQEERKKRYDKATADLASSKYRDYETAERISHASGRADREDAQRVINEVDQAKVAYFKGIDNIKQLKGELAEQKSQAQRDAEALKRAESASERNATKVDALTDEVAQLKAMLAIKEGGAGQVAKTKSEEASSKAVGEIEGASPEAKGQVAAIRGAGIAIDNARAGGKAITNEERDLITQLGSMLKGKQVTFAEAVKMIEGAGTSDTALLALLRTNNERTISLGAKSAELLNQYNSRLKQIEDRLGLVTKTDTALAGAGYKADRTGSAVSPRVQKVDFTAPGMEHAAELAAEYRKHFADFSKLTIDGHRMNAEAIIRAKRQLEEEMKAIRQAIADAHL